MSIKEQVSKDFMTAFKAREMEKKTILGILKSEIVKEEQKEGRTSGEASDEEVLYIIKQGVKNLNKTIEQAEKSGDKQDIIDESNFELDILEAYLPKKMSEDEIDAKIKEVVDGGANHIGQIMGAFKGLEVDMKMVSQKAKQLIN